MNATIWSQKEINNIKTFRRRGLDFTTIANNYNTTQREIKYIYLEAIRDAHRKEQEKDFDSILSDFCLANKEFKSLMMEYISDKLVKSNIKEDDTSML